MTERTLHVEITGDARAVSAACRAVDPPPKFCSDCGAKVWELRGTDVLTCRRGHHQPNLWRRG